MDNVELGNGGIILIKKGDTISNILSKFIGIYYTQIGFYYVKTTGGVTTKYTLKLIDIIPLHGSINEYDFHEYIKKEPIGQIKIKKIKNTGLKRFNAIIKSINNNVSINRKELILGIIKGNCLSFNIFNQILTEIDPNVRLDVVKNQLLDSSYFNVDEIINVKTGTFITEHIKSSFVLFCKCMSDLIINDHDIQKEIINYKICNNLEIKLDPLLENYINSSCKVLNIIITGINKRKIKIDDLIGAIKYVESDIQSFDLKLDPIETKTGNGDLILYMDSRTRVNAMNSIRSILSTISNDISIGNIPTIKLNKLIHNYNILCEHIDPNYKQLKPMEDDISAYGLIITNHNSISDIPIQLKNGDKIIIPMNETNYSRFTIEQLEEMLIILDVYSNGNNKFDQIRARITKELSLKKMNIHKNE